MKARRKCVLGISAPCLSVQKLGHKVILSKVLYLHMYMGVTKLLD